MDEAWADELFGRIRDAIAEKPVGTLQTVFDALANAGPNPGAIDYPRFSKFMMLGQIACIF